MLLISASPALLASAATTAPVTAGGKTAGQAASLTATSNVVRCSTKLSAYSQLARKMTLDIASRIQGRHSSIGLEETDSQTGITCTYHANSHFIAASAVKVIILATLLRKANEEHRNLTATELRLAWRMITESDNDAATSLWNDDGPYYLQHFLNLADMKETKLNYAWGLTLLTAHDETLLLQLIAGPNNVLDKPDRIYARYLMAHVTPYQRWGVPAGAPRSVIVHVKNGWLPYGPGGWEINSIGAFTTAHRAYLISVLTYDNPSMAYGVYTIERIAEVIHHDLNPGDHQVIPASTPSPSWGIPDEPIPVSR